SAWMLLHVTLSAPGRSFPCARSTRPPAHRAAFSQVELGDSTTPCLQSDVSARSNYADLARQLSVSSRAIPLLTPANGTLMVRDLDSPGLATEKLHPTWSPRPAWRTAA